MKSEKDRSSVRRFVIQFECFGMSTLHWQNTWFQCRIRLISAQISNISRSVSCYLSLSLLLSICRSTNNRVYRFYIYRAPLVRWWSVLHGKHHWPYCTIKIETTKEFWLCVRQLAVAYVSAHPFASPKPIESSYSVSVETNTFVSSCTRRIVRQLNKCITNLKTNTFLDVYSLYYCLDRMFASRRTHTSTSNRRGKKRFSSERVLV